MKRSLLTFLILFLFSSTLFSQVTLVGGDVYPRWDMHLDTNGGSKEFHNNFSVETYFNGSYFGENVFGKVEGSSNGNTIDLYQAYGSLKFLVGEEFTGYVSAGKFENFWYGKNSGARGMFYHISGGSISEKFVPVNPIGMSFSGKMDHTTGAIEFYNATDSTKSMLIGFSSVYNKVNFGLFFYDVMGTGNFGKHPVYGGSVDIKLKRINLGIESIVNGSDTAIVTFAGYANYNPKKFPVGFYFRYYNDNVTEKTAHAIQEFTGAVTKRFFKQVDVAAGWRGYKFSGVTDQKFKEGWNHQLFLSAGFNF